MRNRVELIGHLGKDPEVITFDNGNKMAKFPMATTETWKDKQGERQTDTQWHNVVVFGKTAETVEKYLKKGSKVLVDGKIKTRTWETDSGEKRYATEIVMQEFTFLDSKSDSNQSNSGEQVADDSDDLPF